MDPRSYPIQFTVTHRFDPSVTGFKRFQDPASGEERVLLAKFGSPNGNHRLEVTDLCESKTYWQHHFGWTTNLRNLKTTDYYLQDGSLDQHTHGRNMIYVACYTDSSVTLLGIAYPEGSVDTLLERSCRIELLTDASWDQSVSGPFLLPPEDGQPFSMAVKVGSGYYPAPRELVFFDLENPPAQDHTFTSGSPIAAPPLLADLDRDGLQDMLCATSAPCNGRIANGLNDSIAYYLALKHDGRPLWITETPLGGGSAVPIVEERGGALRVYGSRTYRNYGTEEPYTLLHELDPRSGRILREQRLPGLVVWPDGHESREERWAILANHAGNTLRWIDRDFKPFGEARLIPALLELMRNAVRCSDRDDVLLAVRLENRATTILDQDFEILARAPFQLRGDTGNEGSVLQCSTSQPMLGLARDGRLLLATARSLPWWRWWTWRWRWLLILVIAPPLAGSSAYYITRYFYLRRKSRIEQERRHRELRELSHRQHSLQENERSRVSRELHDDLGQRLVLLKMILKRGLDRVRGELAQDLAEAIQNTDSSLSAMRRVISELRPAILDDLGLEAAIEWQLERFERSTGLPAEFSGDVEGLDLSAFETTALFRVLQESLTNAAKHARASLVEVRLLSEDGNVVLEVRDDGRGFDPTNAGGASLGLISMRERLAAIGGLIDLQSAPGQGTAVRALVPRAKKEDHGDTSPAC